MKKIEIGHTGIVIEKNGIGCLPLQRIPKEEAVVLLRKAYENGFNFFDTARAYSDSEEKVGEAFKGIRDKVIIATKTMAKTAEKFNEDLEKSLEMLQTEYIDIYQFHNPPFCPKPGQDNGLYEAMLKAKEEGKVRHIGITNHRLAVAQEAIDSGLYETLQFPFSYLAGEPEHALVDNCKKAGMGFIAMKGLAGGLITHAAAAYAFLAQYDHVAPIWGIQKEAELDEWLAFQDNPPALTPELQALIDRDRKELSGNFCRGCAYCQPCPAGIQIQDCNRMSLFLRRAPHSVYLTEEWLHKMERIDGCLHCNHCVDHCPYGLDTPNLLVDNYRDFMDFWHRRQG